MDVISYSPFFVAITGGCVGGLIGFAANFARLRWDVHLKRVDSFCEEISETANAATEHWLTEFASYAVSDGRLTDPDGEPLSETATKAVVAAKMRALQISSSQIRIASTGIHIIQGYSASDRQRYDELLASFFIAISTDDPTKDGLVDLNRAAHAQGQGATLIAFVRRAAVENLRTRSILRSLLLRTGLPALWQWAVEFPRRA